MPVVTSPAPASGTDHGQPALDDLVSLLDLEELDVNLYRGFSPPTTRTTRVFGGQVAGQALVAAGRAVPQDRPVDSPPAYFIPPRGPAVASLYNAERGGGGGSFTPRPVV